MEKIPVKFQCQKWAWEHKPDEKTLERIESAGRTCYKSEDKITKSSSEAFVRSLLKSGHLSVIEHSFASVRIITSRAVANELVRHRLASFSQESTRYVNYRNKGFEIIYPEWIARYVVSEPNGKDIAFGRLRIWSRAMEQDVEAYLDLLDFGLRPEDARGVLPLDLKTELVVSANLREWRHIFKLRLSPGAHPQMKQLIGGMLPAFQKVIPVLFDDI